MFALVFSVILGSVQSRCLPVLFSSPLSSSLICPSEYLVRSFIDRPNPCLIPVFKQLTVESGVGKYLPTTIFCVGLYYLV